MKIAYVIALSLAAIWGCTPQKSEWRTENQMASPWSEAREDEPERLKIDSGQLVNGVDGAVYESYKPFLVERIQLALKDRGLYSGPVNGLLDAVTMSAISAFQKANYNLQVCGVPTPRTRLLLAQGSHTDPQ
jgi:hypothetical protein